MFSELMKETVSKQFALKSPKGVFGIEIETEGAGLPPGMITKFFEGKQDGSLRNGMEYVSKVLPADAVAERVDELRACLNTFGARIAPTYRSSTHIHMNFCDRTFRDVLGMTVLWALVEPVVFRLMPPGRDGSLFCVSSYDSGELSDFTDRFCDEIGKGFKHNGFAPRGKYSSLNLTRLGHGHDPALGTLEFRVFPSSLDGTQIQEWCDWLFRMGQIVAAETDDSFLSMVRNAEQNPLPFLTGIFGKLPIPEDEAGQYVDFGARTAYEMARVIDRHLKKKAKKSKEEVPAEPVMAFQPGLRAGEIAMAAPRGLHPPMADAPRPRGFAERERERLAARNARRARVAAANIQFGEDQF